MSVAEATRNVAITGARPLGVTNCLNFGDPTRPEAFWQLTEAVRGLGDACRALGLPVTGGNVSLYNESPRGRDRADAGDRRRRAARGRRAARRAGVRGRRRHRSCSSARRRRASPGSEYAALAGLAAEDGPPALDLATGGAASRRSSARRPRAACSRRAQDVSGGGLAVALAEAAIWAGDDRGLGATLRLPVASSPAVDLFGESPSRLVVSCRPAPRPGARRCSPGSTACRSRSSGTVGGERLVVELAGAGATGAAEERGSRVADALDVGLDELRHAWEHGLPRALGWEDG